MALISSYNYIPPRSLIIKVKYDGKIAMLQQNVRIH
jgi:hypothetical protein